jgi:hypothetical protein
LFRFTRNVPSCLGPKRGIERRNHKYRNRRNLKGDQATARFDTASKIVSRAPDRDDRAFPGQLLMR